MPEITRADVETLDQQDPLARLRTAFELPANQLYFNGNSLGAMPRAISQRLRDFAEKEWGQQIVRGWVTQGWYEMPQRVGGKIARLIGAAEDEVIVTDTTSINIFKLAVAALGFKSGRTKIVTTRDIFPTDIYILEGVVNILAGRAELCVVESEKLCSTIDQQTALVVLSPVNYKSGALFDMAKMTAQIQTQGAMVLWDLSHSCGAHEVDLHRIDADFAVGCGYKFLNGGPGAPAYLYVAHRWQQNLQQPLTGWKGHAAPFAMSPEYRPAEGVTRLLCGTHPVIAMTCLEQAVDLFGTVEMSQVQQKSRRMGDLFITLAEQRCADYGLTLLSPKDSTCRGSQVSFQHPGGYAIVQSLIEKNVICDFRAPDVVRFGITPLYQKYTDVWDAVECLVDLLKSGAWQERDQKPSATVT
ncbi:MAG: kynureninase [Pseudomonadales bacterium]|nr:kynureninase [Pseudomonadales bacterium]